MPLTDSHLLGPFIGNVTASTAAIWLQIPNLAKDETRTVFVTLHQGAASAQDVTAGVINATCDALNVGIVRFDFMVGEVLGDYSECLSWRWWHDHDFNDSGKSLLEPRSHC
jgi:hypothetical protein